jgi:hypothetical protein
MVGCQQVHGAAIRIALLHVRNQHSDAAVDKLNVVEILLCMRTPVRVALRVQTQQMKEDNGRAIPQLGWCCCTTAPLVSEAFWWHDETRT